MFVAIMGKIQSAMEVHHRGSVGDLVGKMWELVG